MTLHMVFDRLNKRWVLQKSERGSHIKQTHKRVIYPSSKEGIAIQKKVPLQQTSTKKGKKHGAMRGALVKNLTVITLQNMCVDLGKTKSGNKDELIAKVKRDVKDLNNFDKDTLRDMCEDLELTKSGTKDEIIERLSGA